MNETKKTFKVIIIGAGLASLSAANYLLNHNLQDILILEAKSQPGGRVQTITFGTEKIELGGQWIHGEQNQLYSFAKRSGQLDPTQSWERRGHFLLPSGDPVDPSLISEILDWLENTIDYVEDNFSIQDLQSNPSKWRKDNGYSSMGQFLETRFHQYLADNGVVEGSAEFVLKNAIFQWGMSFQRIDNSCRQMSELSLFRWSEFQINPGRHYNNFANGGSELIAALLQPLRTSPNVVTILCDSPVENINWAGNFVEVRTRAGQTFHGEIILCTIPIGVLKSKLDVPLFTPTLPKDMADAVNATGFGPCAKIHLIWNESTRWWPEGLEGYQFLWPKAKGNELINYCEAEDADEGSSSPQGLRESWVKSITGFDPLVTSPNVLVGWLGGEEATFVETLDEKEVGLECVKLLRTFTKMDVPMPDGVIVSKWNTDEFFGGAYSFRSTDGDEIVGDISATLSKPLVRVDAKGVEKPVLLFAGEATNKRHYSTLHGAYESGESQASKILHYFETCSSSIAFAQNGMFLPKIIEGTMRDEMGI